ncbi:MAG: hypothetical protein K2Y33_04690 [Mycolicibacterium frederiksbergense]|nr:hypothetical protein [Mycolicibacterium frederiksbergense]
MTCTPAQRCAQLAATAVEKLIEIGAPMDSSVVAQVERYRQAGPVSTAELLSSAAALIAAMAPGSAHAQSAAFLVPELQCRAAGLADEQPSNVIAAQQLFPQHTR